MMMSVNYRSYSPLSLEYIEGLCSKFLNFIFFFSRRNMNSLRRILPEAEKKRIWYKNQQFLVTLPFPCSYCIGGGGFPLDDFLEETLLSCLSYYRSYNGECNEILSVRNFDTFQTTIYDASVPLFSISFYPVAFPLEVVDLEDVVEKFTPTYDFLASFIVKNHRVLQNLENPTDLDPNAKRYLEIS